MVSITKLCTVLPNAKPQGCGPSPKPKNAGNHAGPHLLQAIVRPGRERDLALAGGWPRTSIVVASLKEIDSVTLDHVHDTMLLGETSRPGIGREVL
jgi:hypothetical protein